MNNNIPEFVCISELFRMGDFTSTHSVGDIEIKAFIIQRCKGYPDFNDMHLHSSREKYLKEYCA